MVRCTAVYSQSQHRADVVRLCPNHAVQIDKEGLEGFQRGVVGGASVGHFVRSDEQSAKYEIDPTTGRWVELKYSDCF